MMPSGQLLALAQPFGYARTKVGRFLIGGRLSWLGSTW